MGVGVGVGVVDPVDPPDILVLRPSSESAPPEPLHALNRLMPANINGAIFSALENFIDPLPGATAVPLHVSAGTIN